MEAIGSGDIKPIRVEIKCAIPFAIYAEGEYRVNLSAGTVPVSIRRVRQDPIDSRIGIESGDFDITEDRSGLVSYSEFFLSLDYPTFEELQRQVGGHTNIEILRGIARTVINHILDAYREATKTPWIRRFADSDLYMLEGQATYANGEVQVIASLGPPRSITPPLKGLSEETHQRFLENLDSEEAPPVWDTLWLDSEDALSRGDYRSVVISGHSALETLSHATILAWLREQSLQIDEAVAKLARNKNERGRLGHALSLEELTELLNDTRKVEIALFDVLSADPSWGFDLYMRFGRLAAARNSVLHSGADVGPKDAKGHLDLVRAIRELLTNQPNLERIRRSRAQPAGQVLAFHLQRNPHPSLAELLSELEADGFQVTIWSMQRFPEALYRKEARVAIITKESRIRIYLPKKNQLNVTDCELQLTRVLLKHKMVKEEGWPIADVSDQSAAGNLSLGAINWEGYRWIAEAITDAVLGVEIERRLREIGMDTRSRTKQQIIKLESCIGRTDFEKPQWGELDYFLLPIKALTVQLVWPEGSTKLIRLLQSRTPEQAGVFARIFAAVSKSGWGTPEEAATAMLAVKSGLGVLDTIGVREAPKRVLRTRLNTDELQRLDWK